VGGVTETVIPGETGIFFNEQSWEALLDAVLNFNYENWQSEKIREHALKFSTESFKDKIKRYVEDRYEEFKQGLNQCKLDIK
jgi:glycosyltransferase involved in cell wall biosynthesis